MKQEKNTDSIQTISLSDLLALCLAFKGVGFATLVTNTVPKQVKGGNPWLIGKISHVLVNWGKWRYGSALETQARREGKNIEFDVKPRRWGTRVPNSPLVHHVDKQGVEKYYLEAKIEQVLSKPKYFDINSGISLTRSDVEPHLRGGQKSSTQEGLEKEVYLRDYALTSIVELHALGNQYLVKQS